MKRIELKETLTKLTKELFNLEPNNCSEDQLYVALLHLCQKTVQAEVRPTPKRKLYYFSAEFLLGKLLSNNLLALGIFQDVKALLNECGKDLTAIEAVEMEPSLGNGGLGRLAACFLDSIAALGLPGDGVGLNYHYGLFQQKFINNKQTETPNPWIEDSSWLIDTQTAFTVNFADFALVAKMYDIAVPGADQPYSNRLHLFDVENPSHINGKDINFDKKDIAHNLTAFLYPDDSDQDGQLLRVYQQYFMVSAGAQLILKELEMNGYQLENLAEHVVIQINDTHPSMFIPEMIRLLVERGLSMDKAVAIVSQTCAYTNHTILAEALEKWPLDYIKAVAPQIVPVIEELDRRVKARYQDPRVAVLDDQGRVHMAHIDIHYSYSVNGVAQLHTDILKNSELKAFADIYPEKFNNKTNGVTFRRWLEVCNPSLTALIDQYIGSNWRQNTTELTSLLDFVENEEVLDQILAIKYQGKQRLCNFLQQKQGLELDPNSVFDIQIKRLHEYKRQQMNALYIIYKYMQIKAGNYPKRPITIIFGAKAAPAYKMAKNIIHLILCLQEMIAKDSQVCPWLRVVMVENYNVTCAEYLIPACEISEQISLASKEASGTGNMKFMANGAVTLGTMDGANVEIAELVGNENIYVFGTDSDTVINLYENHSYKALDMYHREKIENLVDFIISDEILSLGDAQKLAELWRDLKHKDWFMALLDIEAYIKAKDQALNDYEDRKAWAKKMLINVAKSGFFSSDRTIRQYNEDIWHLM